MKLNFTLLEVQGEPCEAAPEQPASQSAVALARLKSACAAGGAPCLTVSGGSAVVPAGLEPGCVLLVAGSPAPDQLRSLCLFARHNGHHVIVVTDAVDSSRAGIKEAMAELYEQLVQLSPAAAVLSLIKSNSPFLYAFPKADSTATVAVFFAGGKKVLVIERAHDPYKGCESLPGGFLNIQLEDLPGCAARELREETGIVADPTELRLVDVRSRPDRDDRGHVIDHGYAWLVAAAREQEVLASLKAGDDAGSVRIVDVAELLARPIAFDHKDLLVAALKAFGL
ncbi:MAG TPA: NUDIX hydrolase [Candidatus Obscuribacterales bacterium]